MITVERVLIALYLLFVGWAYVEEFHIAMSSILIFIAFVFVWCGTGAGLAALAFHYDSMGINRLGPRDGVEIACLIAFALLGPVAGLTACTLCDWRGLPPPKPKRPKLPRARARRLARKEIP